MCLCDPSPLYSAGIERYRGGERCLMLLSCSDKVSNITISPSSPKNCYKPISKIAPIYSAKTVSSSRRQCKLLGWIMSVSFRGVYQRGSITHRPKSEIGPATSASFSFSLSLSPLSLLQAAGVLPRNSLLLLLRTQDGAQSHYYMATPWKLRNSSTSRHRNTLWKYRMSHRKKNHTVLRVKN